MLYVLIYPVLTKYGYQLADMSIVIMHSAMIFAKLKADVHGRIDSDSHMQALTLELIRQTEDNILECPQDYILFSSAEQTLPESTAHPGYYPSVLL